MTAAGWESNLRLAEQAARKAGALLRDVFSADAGVQSREAKDLKTVADVEAERVIVDCLSPTGIPILGEEQARAGAGAPGLRWLVDPLDGTMNFSRGFPVHAVSIALWDGMRPVAGVILDLARDRMYSGAAGHGAWRDGTPIRVSQTADRGQAILATGFPSYRDYGSESLNRFIGRIQAFKKIRMIGSAALSLAMVAEGTFDAYFEEDIMIWDVAAGLAIVEAAGGRNSVEPGSREHALTVSATNALITT